MPLSGLSVENLQARVRGTLLMALSNEHGHLVLTTGNKSELATGFSTLYGDSAGGFAPIKDVPKSLVWELARWRNARQAPGGDSRRSRRTASTSRRRPSCAPGQLDSDRLPPYEVLDALLDAYVEQDRGRAQLVAPASTASSSTGWSGSSTPPSTSAGRTRRGPRSTSRAFGRDRRLPITSRWRELAAPTAPKPPEARPEQA